MNETDSAFIRRTLALARRGKQIAAPNPMVGALLVARNGTIVAEGYHRGPGTPHAEAAALNAARKTGITDFSGMTLYVNLEPCCHTGRTPPCTEAIIKAGISRVVCGMEDPNPLVHGKGIGQLREAGCTVHSGVLEKECRELNTAFVTFHEKKRPFFTLKTASSLDGKITASNGQSQWITSPASRKNVHQLRARHSAVLTGIGTVLADDPLLTVRVGKPAQEPVRIVLDTRLRIPLSSRLVQTARDIPLITVCSSDFLSSPEGTDKKVSLEKAGVCVLGISETEGRIDLHLLAGELAARNISSVLIEAGGTLAWSFLSSGLVDRIRMYIAPALLGGERAMGIFSGPGVETLEKRISITNLRRFSCGEDLVLEGCPCLPD